jgi:prolyl-tRNA synthetase
VAPFRAYLARLGDDPAVVKEADGLYESLTQSGIQVLYDDRDVRPGEKFADADLLGIPYRVVISSKTQTAGTFELKPRSGEQAEQVSREKLNKTLGISG